MLISIPINTKSWSKADKRALEKIVRDTTVEFVNLANKHPEKSLRLQIVEVGGKKTLH
jgi:hypothetical protein